MSIRRVKAARGPADANQKVLVQRAKELGFTVVDLAPVGGGIPDLLVSTPLEMWLVEVKRHEVRGLTGEFTEKQINFYSDWEGKDLLVWYEPADVDLLFLLCDRAGHFHGTHFSPEASELREGRAINVLSPKQERRGGGGVWPDNITRVPRTVQHIRDGFLESFKFFTTCEISSYILSGGATVNPSQVLQGPQGE